MRIPELSYQEVETSAFVQSKLREWGIPFSIMAETGVVGMIEGENPASSCIALRADMDALPINEANNVEYKSTNTGVMHACGHDVHTAMPAGRSEDPERTAWRAAGQHKTHLSARGRKKSRAAQAS